MNTTTTNTNNAITIHIGSFEGHGCSISNFTMEIPVEAIAVNLSGGRRKDKQPSSTDKTNKANLPSSTIETVRTTIPMSEATESWPEAYARIRRRHPEADEYACAVAAAKVSRRHSHFRRAHGTFSIGEDGIRCTSWAGHTTDEQTHCANAICQIGAMAREMITLLENGIDPTTRWKKA